MTEHTRYRAAVGDFIEGRDGGEFHCKSICGAHIVIELGPAQILSTKRGLDRYVANYEVAECKAKG